MSNNKYNGMKDTGLGFNESILPSLVNEDFNKYSKELDFSKVDNDDGDFEVVYCTGWPGSTLKIK